MRRTAYAVAGVVSLALIGTTFVAATANPNPPGPVARAQSAINSGAVKLHGDATGHVDYVSAPSGHALAAPKGMTVKSLSSAADVARANVDDFASAFGVADPKDNLKQVNAVALGKGSIVRFQQTDNGLPVIGAQLVVSQDANGGLQAINGRASDAIGVATTASVSSATAAKTASSAAATATKSKSASLTASAPKLSIYDPALIPGAGDGLGARPVYQVSVTSGKNAAINQYVLVDARTGSIVLSFSQTATLTAANGTKPVTASAKPAVVKNTEPPTQYTTDIVCDFNDQVFGDEDPTCPSNDVPTVADPATAGGDIESAYNLTGAVNNFYNDVTGRLGIDDHNMGLISSTRFCYDDETFPDGSSDCPYENAFWNGTQMTFGEGFASAPDVVGHELTHGVTQYTSDLLYYYQSGAIDESMSDVMGELFDIYNGTDSASGSWLLGEGLPIGAIRSMSNPPAFDQPGAMNSSLWGPDPYDNGGVHTDSGVGNHAAYLMAHGGTYNGVTMTGFTDGNMVGKMAQLYLGVDELLSPTSDYGDLANALTQSCTNLETAGGPNQTTALDCTSVKNAINATRMTLPPSTSREAAIPQAAECGSGYTPQTVFADNFNRPASGTVGNGWTESGTPEIDGFAAPNAAAGNAMLIPDDPGNGVNVTRYAYTPLTIPSSAHTDYLYFQHLDAYNWDTVDSPTIYIEGLYIDYQLSGSSTWNNLDTSNSTWSNGPAKRVWKTTLGPDGWDNTTEFSGHAFAGDSRGWTSSRVTLPTSLKGKSVRFRFRSQVAGFWIGTAAYGTWIDNVAVNDCIKAPPAVPTVPTSVAVKGYHGTATMTWGPSSTNGGSAITAYAVYVEAKGGTNIRTTLSPSARTFTWTGLAQGTDYRFEIRTENSAGLYSSYVVWPEMVGSTLTMTPSATTVPSGTAVTLSGKLTKTDDASALTSRTIVLYQRAHGTTTWTAVSPTTTTAADGTYSFTVNPSASEDYYVHYSTGSGTTMGSVASTQTVTVS